MSHNKLKYCIKIILISLMFLNSCTTMMNNKTVKYNENKVLKTISSIDSSFNEFDSLLYVDINDQNMYLLKKGTISQAYKISSSYYGEVIVRMNHYREYMELHGQKKKNSRII